MVLMFEKRRERREKIERPDQQGGGFVRKVSDQEFFGKMGIRVEKVGNC